MTFRVYQYTTKPITSLWGAMNGTDRFNVTSRPGENNLPKGAGIKVNYTEYYASIQRDIDDITDPWSCGFNSLASLAESINVAEYMKRDFKIKNSPNFEARIENGALCIISDVALNIQNLNLECDVVGELGFTCKVMLMEE